VAEKNGERLLDIRDLTVSFPSPSSGFIYPVDGVGLHIEKGETLGLVGESGSGKSMTSLAVLGLVPRPHGKIVSGSICFKGRDLVSLNNEEMMKLRGKEISMIFQEPMSSLNPVYTIGYQIMEGILAHREMSKHAARDRAVEMLSKVGIPSPEKRMDAYPHLLSGGMRQRAMIAMALALNPELLIADEPTTALDVTIQAQILELLDELKRERTMSVLLITHNLGIVAESAQRVAVMYAGRILELASTEDLFRSPLHPYTQGLMDSIPPMDGRATLLRAIPGMVPSLESLPPGCKFSNRCSLAEKECLKEEPILLEAVPGHFSRCRRWSELAGRSEGR
jgi:peptide/nickel transport system ATP-binding protein/oligopeptide transport system ATP-binding protein